MALEKDANATVKALRARDIESCAVIGRLTKGGPGGSVIYVAARDPGTPTPHVDPMSRQVEPRAR